ncbi:hypothetical protein ACLOJK_022776, partial [Asimina triloba]
MESSNSSEEAHSVGNAEAASPAGHMSPIRSAANAGSVGSMGETLDASKGAIADRMSPIRSAANAGSAGSMGETPNASEGALEGVISSTALVGDLVDLATAAYDLNDVSLPSMSELLGGVIGVDMSEIEDTDVVPRTTTSLSGEAKSHHPEEGEAEHSVGGSDDHSSLGQHIPSNAASVLADPITPG